MNVTATHRASVVTSLESPLSASAACIIEKRQTKFIPQRLGCTSFSC